MERTANRTAISFLAWQAGWNVINEEDNCGNLRVTYVHDPGKVVGTILARIEGSDPANGTYRYYCQDIIGSTRSVWNENKTEYASYDYTPYGEVYAHSGADVTHRFTGQEWDNAAHLYYFPFRYYSPETARWSVREPSGADGPNLYWYGFDTPVNGFDWLGLRFYFDNIDAITDIHSNWTRGRYGGFHFGGPANVGRPSSPGAAAAGAFFQGVGENTLSIFTPYSNPCEPTVGQAKLWGRVSLALLVAAVVVGPQVPPIAQMRILVMPHPAHHTFPIVGKVRHISITIWRAGVKGWRMRVQIPIPFLRGGRG
jgi:RHS repeat-associated protein